MERELACCDLWMTLGCLALARHQKLRAPALPSFSQLTRLLRIAFDFGRLACSLSLENPRLGPPAGYLADEAALKKSYGPHNACKCQPCESTHTRGYHHKPLSADDICPQASNPTIGQAHETLAKAKGPRKFSAA